jgi:hypothetical protein
MLIKLKMLSQKKGGTRKMQEKEWKYAQRKRDEPSSSSVGFESSSQDDVKEVSAENPQEETASEFCIKQIQLPI